MDFLGKLKKIKTDRPDVDFLKASDIAKQTAKERSADPMMFSWYRERIGEGYPTLECGKGDKPTWIDFAESGGGALTIAVNEGEYIFVFLSFVK